MIKTTITNKNGKILDSIKIHIPQNEGQDLIEILIAECDLYCCDSCEEYFRFEELEDADDEECNFYCHKCFRGIRKK